jgi:hypothetical protein
MIGPAPHRRRQARAAARELRRAALRTVAAEHVAALPTPENLQVSIDVDARLRFEIDDRRGAAAPIARTVSGGWVRQYL